MRDFEYLDIDILEMNYVKDLDEDEDLEIEFSISYTLNFDVEERMAYGDCYLNIDGNNHMGKLSVEIHTVGIFSYMAENLTDGLRKRYHKESINILNPKWNEIVFKLTELAGIPPIELETIEIDDEDIVLNNGENLN